MTVEFLNNEKEIEKTMICMSTKIGEKTRQLWASIVMAVKDHRTTVQGNSRWDKECGLYLITMIVNDTGILSEAAMRASD